MYKRYGKYKNIRDAQHPLFVHDPSRKSPGMTHMDCDPRERLGANPRATRGGRMVERTRPRAKRGSRGSLDPPGTRGGLGVERCAV